MKKRGERKRKKGRKREVENELHYAAHLYFIQALPVYNIHKILSLLLLLITSSPAERKDCDGNYSESDVDSAEEHNVLTSGKMQFTTDGAHQHTAWWCIYVFNVCVCIWRAGWMVTGKITIGEPDQWC